MSALTPPSTTPTFVWNSLTLELKERTVQLMAQLAFNRIADQSGWFTKEPDHVQPIQQPKNPV
ncbi:MAG: hypothetical protein EHM81_02545 [Chloroflexi bacterium]|nr:MAG: hypothetical protein EHM81_02545 [Chloroflexota bacterium]